MGYSAREAVRYLKGRFRIAVPEKTFRLWYTTHKPICTYHTIRAAIKRRIEPAGLIEKHDLQHRQVYLYTLHHGKLEHLLAYPYHRAYEPMRAYLSSVTHQTFPHELFTPDNPVRSSTYPVRLSTHVTRKENYATRLVALALHDHLVPVLENFLDRHLEIRKRRGDLGKERFRPLSSRGLAGGLRDVHPVLAQDAIEEPWGFRVEGLIPQGDVLRVRVPFFRMGGRPQG